MTYYDDQPDPRYCYMEGTGIPVACDRCGEHLMIRDQEYYCPRGCQDCEDSSYPDWLQLFDDLEIPEELQLQEVAA